MSLRLPAGHSHSCHALILTDDRFFAAIQKQRQESDSKEREKAERKEDRTLHQKAMEDWKAADQLRVQENKRIQEKFKATVAKWEKEKVAAKSKGVPFKGVKTKEGTTA